MKSLTVLGQSMNVRVSPSFLQTAACPFCLKCKYIDKVEDRFIRVASLRGSAAHDAVAELTAIAVNDEIPVRELSDDQLLEAVRRHTPHEIMSELGLVLEWVRLWRDRFVITKHYVGHEERFAIDESYAESSWDNGSYRGIIDYTEKVAKHATIIDYKSQAHVLSQAELDAHDQLSFYSWLKSKEYEHVEVFTCRIWYLRYGFYGETRRTMDDVMRYEQRMLLQLQKVLDITDWAPIPGEHCGLCDFIHLCPIAQDLSQPVKQIISQSQAEHAAGRLRVLKTIVSAIEGSLKSYVKANDAVRIGGDFAFGYKGSETLTWDVTKVEELLRAEGYTLSEVASISATVMKKFLKKLTKTDPMLWEQLQLAATPKTKPQFKGYKIAAAKGKEDEAEEDEVEEEL